MEHLILFLQSRHAKGLALCTIAFYRHQIESYLTWSNGKVDRQSITAYIAHLRDVGIKPIAFARAIRVYVRWLHAEGLIEAIRFEMPKNVTPYRPCLTSEQLRDVLRACKSSRDRGLLLFMLDTGCRRQEVCSITWNDVDLLQGSVTIRRGKGGKGRVVFIGRKALDAIRRLPQPHVGSLFGLRPAGLRMTLQRIGNRAGIHLSPHMLRRSFATEATKNGMGPFLLQRCLGHSNISTTMSYVQLVSSDLQQAHAMASPADRLTG